MKQKVIFLLGSLAFLAGMLFYNGAPIHPPHPPASPTAETPAPPSIDEPAQPSVQARAPLAETAKPEDSQHNIAYESTPPPISPAATMLNKLDSIKTEKNSDDSAKTFVYQDKVYPLQTYAPLATPNDPQASQWWVTNARLNTAWDTPVGGRQTVLAVIDTGFGLEHEEFENRWHINEGETGEAASEAASQLNCTDRSLALNASCNLIDDDSDGIVDNEIGTVLYENPSRLNCTDQGRPLTKDCNLIDDDSNGYIDDVNGWDFINNDNSSQAGELNPTGSGTTHGTRVTGVAAATGNNNLGIAGVDWHTRILPVQAIDDDSYGDTLSVARSILYAASRGADVINLSLGSTGPDAFVREAVKTAIASGSVVVASSGNDGCNCMVYPASYPEVVAVGALDTDNAPADFSSWGATLDVLAPGTGITSASWTSGNQTSAYASGIAGTSYAAPMFSGALTRLLSHHPEITPLQLIALATEQTNRLTLGTNVVRSNTLGFGTLDAAAATTRATTPLADAQLYSFAPVSNGNRSEVYEAAGSYAAYSCESSRPGTSPVHELTKGSEHIFTVSDVEAYHLQAEGFSKQLLAHACLLQPHDQPAQLREINVFSEFRNIFRPAS